MNAREKKSGGGQRKLSHAVKFIQGSGFPAVVQYVDDFVVVAEDKDVIKAFAPKLREWLVANLGIRLHPRKCYIQHYSKGVSFVGGIIKPHRKYVSKRTRRKALAKVHWLITSDAPLKEAMPSVNSYLGVTRHFSNYKLRHTIMEELFAHYHSKIYFTNNINKMALRKITPANG